MSNQLCKSCKPDRKKKKKKSFLELCIELEEKNKHHVPSEKLPYSDEILNNVL